MRGSSSPNCKFVQEEIPKMVAGADYTHTEPRAGTKPITLEAVSIKRAAKNICGSRNNGQRLRDFTGLQQRGPKGQQGR